MARLDGGRGGVTLGVTHRHRQQCGDSQREERDKDWVEVDKSRVGGLEGREGRHL